MTARVEEIRRQAQDIVSQWLATSGATANTDWLYKEEEDGLVALIIAALAQAEREREELEQRMACQSYQFDITRQSLVEARAEVERLKNEVQDWRVNHLAENSGHLLRCVKVNGKWSCRRECAVSRAEQAEAALARVRAIVEDNRKQNVLGQFICDNCGKEWPTHDLEFCIVGQIGAALEGRG